MLYNRGYGSVEYRSVEDVLTIEFTQGAADVAAGAAAGHARSLPPRVDGRHAGRRRAHAAADERTGKSEFQVNGVPFWKAKPYLGEARRDADLDGEERHRSGITRSTCTASSSCRWTRRAQPVRPLAWKDTVNVPMKTTVRVARDVRRAAGHVDVPLPHPRPRRGRPDGHGARRRRRAGAGHAHHPAPVKKQ